MFKELAEAGYSISDDKSKLDIGVINGYLARSYWSPDVPVARTESSIRHSHCFGIYYNSVQVGFCRVVTDYTTMAYLADVFVLEEHRGKGLSKWMMHTILNFPDFILVKKWILGTLDAHGLYAQFGFEPFKEPQRWMEKTMFKSYGDYSNK